MQHILGPCCVIRIPFDFNDGLGPIPKRFVIVGHQSGAAIAIKATSKTKSYHLRPGGFNGVAVFDAGECAAFELDTVIDPANCFAIQHRILESYHRNGHLKHLGAHHDLRARLLKAVEESTVLEPARKNGLRRLLLA